MKAFIDASLDFDAVTYQRVFNSNLLVNVPQLKFVHQINLLTMKLISFEFCNILNSH